MSSGKRAILLLLSVVLLAALALGIHNIRRAKKVTVRIAPKIAKVPRVAIVIDDLGYNRNNLSLIYGIKEPLTLAILPNLPYTEGIVQEAREKGCEIILHLPLESSRENAPMEASTIRIGMKKSEVLERLRSAINDVPTLRGVSNHMGSRITADKGVMGIIFSELKKKKLYFLDTLVTDKSVCSQAAKEAGVKFAKRNVYLDNISDAEYIRNQFRLLMKKTKKTGFAIGVGHDRPLTIEVLAEEMPIAEKEGIKFVFVSEMVK